MTYFNRFTLLLRKSATEYNEVQFALVIMWCSGTSNCVISKAHCSQCVAEFAARGNYPSMSVLHHECGRSATISFAFLHFEFSKIHFAAKSRKHSDIHEYTVHVATILPPSNNNFRSQDRPPYKRIHVIMRCVITREDCMILI